MSQVLEELERSRADLLDLSLRNTLLNYRRLKSKGVRIIDEVPQEVFRLLVGEERTMSFLPAPEELVDDEARQIQGDLLAEWLEENEDDLTGQEGEAPAARHQDTKLQTPYPAPLLERRLLNTYYAARTTIEEQGVNTLYLALGMLRWLEAPSSEEGRIAPLILIPVSLSRSSAQARFRLRYTGDELGDNLSLHAKLKAEFRIEMPDLPTVEDLDPRAFFDDVADAIRGQDRWAVDREAVDLGFFWFTKLLMYEDLAPEKWEGHAQPDLHPVLGSLLSEEGFAATGSPFEGDQLLDEQFDLEDLHPIRDADSSQTLAILDVQEGRNLVIQGPPGTGKSQTISNLVAESVARGKKVLFVAEKMAALDVVKRRLDEDGVGDACLELHSHRTNKRSFLEELRRTLELGRPEVTGLEKIQALVGSRDRLNRYVKAVHRPIGESGTSPYQAFGRALRAANELGDDHRPLLEKRSGWADWPAAEFRHRMAAVQEMERVVQTAGVPSEHPFWSSRKKAFLPRDRDRLVQVSREAEERLGRARTRSRMLAELLHLREPTTFQETRRLLQAAELTGRMPSLEGVAVRDPAWSEHGDRITALVEQGLEYQGLRETFDDQLLREAWSRDLLSVRQALVRFGDRWWRLFVPEHWRAVKELRSLCETSLPRGREDRLALVDAIRRSQELEDLFNQESAFMGRLFGSRWRGATSDWSHLDRVRSWMRESLAGIEEERLPPDFLACTEAEVEAEEAHRSAREAAAALEALESVVSELETLLELERETGWLREGDEIEIAFEALAERLSSWGADPEAAHDIVRFNHADEELRKLGLGELAEIAARWPRAEDRLTALLSYEWHNTLIERALAEREELARFDGRSHRDVLRSFQKLDRELIEANRARVALAHWEQLPATNAGGQLGTLRHEMEKKRRHIPIRQLMERAGDAVLRIKPVLMMSPLSVATYLPPGSAKFDLVFFDEASQIRPVDAFGAILRGNQAVVVGDSKQLPPTPFFEKLLDDQEEEDRSTTGDLESILGLFVSKDAPERMLRWHYRSRHDSLIAVSNQEFYENQLFVFPSPDYAREECGVVLHHHPKTVYEPRAKRYNLQEAEIVADAVMAHARERPDLSLGVAAFSQSQAQQIQDQIEVRRRRNPYLESFFNSHPDEPWFVKNLENVQGDERDVILISVGYGKQEDGTLWMNFGPLNQDGGERRLNVLTTRARLRCEVFSNFKADEIQLGRTGARGVVALKRYLKYAEDGHLDLPAPSERPPDSVFEEEVAAAVRSLGYEVHAQVGSGGFFIDLAAVDPQRPGRYLLGIECDGRSYHSASWARDRDRLRQEVLEGLGWSLHRIWSTDWFNNPDRELRKVAERLERAKVVEGGPNSSAQAEGERFGEAEDAARGAPFQRTSGPQASRELAADPYRCADLSDLPAELRGRELHAVPPGRLARWVAKVVECESPVHESEVQRRLVEAAGYKRTGSRLKSATRRASDHAVQEGLVERRGDFLWMPDGNPPVPRDRGEEHQGIRQMDRIAPEEIEAAVVAVVEAAVSISTDDAVVESARLFGFARTTDSIRGPIDEAIAKLIAEGALEASGSELKITAA